jgi:DNA-binding MarR family transcriptional regulator
MGDDVSKQSRRKQIEELDQVFTEVTRFFIYQWLVNEEEVINPKQFILLRTLYEKERSTVSELAAELKLSTSATTIALNRLVKCGFVNRLRDEQDRRVVWVAPSEKAIPIIERLIERRRALFTELLQHLTDEELEQFSRVLDKMKKGLK